MAGQRVKETEPRPFRRFSMERAVLSLNSLFALLRLAGGERADIVHKFMVGIHRRSEGEDFGQSRC